MLQLLGYLTAGGSSQQTSKLHASANDRGQDRKSRFSVTNSRGVDSAFLDLLSEGRGHHQPVRMVGATVHVWEQLPPNSV